VFKGELSADEDLIIEGHIEGTIAHHKKHLTVGEQGRVKGDIFCARIAVEDGARWIGKIDMRQASKVSAMPKDPVHAEAVRRGKTLPSERAKLN
jgi:hypothetical protein